MQLDELRQFCLSKPGTSEGLPFGPETLVFKVMGKMFAVSSLDEPEPRVNLKCDPQKAIEYREKYPDAIIPGWHMNKVHWNTIYLDRGLELRLIEHLINHSYELVVSKLTKKVKKELEELK